VVAVSDAVAESIADYPSRDTRTIANGVLIDTHIDTASVRAELGMTRKYLVVHVGNIRPLKGHRTLVRAAAHLKTLRSDAQIVSIGGEKTDGDLAAIRRFATDMGAADTIAFLGRRDDAVRYSAAADVYVNPADVEGLPISVLEALAYARPVVATAVGGVPSIVKDGVTGLLVPPNDPIAIAEAIDTLLNDPVKAATVAQAGRELVESEYSLEAMVQATESLYDEVIGA
jgi:glycosyltransferase involved in cell wall biosynthesis